LSSTRKSFSHIFEAEKLFAMPPISDTDLYVTHGDIAFVQYIENGWKQYPANLVAQQELDKLVDDIRCTFEKNKDSIVLQSSPQSPVVFIHEYNNAPDLKPDQSNITKNDEQLGTGSNRQVGLLVPQHPAFTPSTSDNSSTIGSEDESPSNALWPKPIENSEKLKERIDWPTPENGRTIVERFLKRLAQGQDNPTGLKRDPAWRMVSVLAPTRLNLPEQNG